MLIRADATLLLVVDLQARLMPAISGGDAVVGRALDLIASAADLGVPVMVSEHCVDKLGGSVPAVRDAAEAAGAHFVHKRHFGCAREPGFLEAVATTGRSQIVVTGAETHVCVLQTVMGLLEAGLRVCVVADAAGSRHEPDKALALQRMQAAGAAIVNTEMVLFEWLACADHSAFRTVLPRIKGGARS